MATTRPQTLSTAAAAIALLVVGGAVVVTILYLMIVRTDAFSEPAQAQLAMTMYYKAVVAKGLLPQLLIALLLRGLSAERFGAGHARALLAWLVCSLVGYAIVAPLLLTKEFAGWPALQMQGFANHLATLCLMVLATSACGFVSERLLGPERRRRRASEGGHEGAS